ncbi:MAG: hypothetical protein WC843_02035 [Candidatus Gracilibacteria bacterium]|jgi:hypothetical protein
MPKIIIDGAECATYESPEHDALSEDLAKLTVEDLERELAARERTMAEETEAALFPAWVLGLTRLTGPIDDHDRKRAQRLLEVTETREALQKVFPKPISEADWEIARGRRIVAEKILEGVLIE